jgi:hypothetical protein
MALITNGNLNTLANTADNYSRISGLQEDLNTLDLAITDLISSRPSGSSDQYIGMQEFLASEPITDRLGDSLLVVPDGLDSYTLASMSWAVGTANTGTFSFKLLIDGGEITSSIVNVGAGEDVDGITFSAGVQIEAGSVLRLETFNSTGATPSGLTVTILANPS